MKYYVYITNCSEHNWMRIFDNEADAIKCCKEVSEHNTAILIKGTKVDWKKKCS